MIGISDSQRRMLGRALWVAGPLACLGVMSSVGVVLAADQQGRIAPGTTVVGVAIGGLSAPDAAARLEAALTPRLSSPVTLVAGTRQASITPTSLLPRLPVAQVAATALARSQQSALPLQAVRAFGLGPAVAVEMPLTLDRARMDRAVERISARLTSPGRSARVFFTAAGRPRIAPSVDGTGPTPSAVRVGIRAGALAAGPARRVRIKDGPVAPALTTEGARARYRRLIVVDKAAQRLTLYRNLKAIKTYRISTAMSGYETPSGEFPIADKQRNPTWTVPNSPWAGELAGQVVPPGPANPLRERWMGLADGVGIHGTSDVGNIGSPASHGCIRMIPAEVIDLFDRVRTGDPVVVR